MTDEWTTVTQGSKGRGNRKGRRNNRKTKIQEELMRRAIITDTATLTLPELRDLFAQCKLDLPRSSFFEALSAVFLEGLRIKEVVCYGIGNFGQKRATPTAPQWQLACIMQLADSIKATSSEIPIYYFEPFMIEVEKDFLLENSIKIISENEKGRRIATGHTFFFMPHCPMSLYTNLLLTNCGNLENVTIFGNSLSAYANRLRQNCHTELLKKLEPLFEEKKIPMTKDDINRIPGAFEQAFNDSSLIRFAEGSTLEVPPSTKEALLLSSGTDETV